MSEKELLRQIKEGNIEAFEHIYHEYYDFLCRFSMHLLHNRQIVEEVVDDVLYYLWDHRQEIEIVSLRGYLVASVRNKSINVAKTSTLNRESFFTHIAWEEGYNFIESLFLMDNRETPLGCLLQTELEMVVQKAIEELPPECRQVFKLSRFEDKKYTEIAQQLDISVNTVKYHMKNALRLLSDSLSRYILLLFLLIWIH